MPTNCSIAFAVRTALAGVLLAGTSLAAAAAEQLEELEEVVVTAQFREQSVQDTPLAITAVSAEMLEARSQTNIAEVANQAPSVSIRQSAPMYGPAVSAYIRGIGQLDFNPALEPGVGMYVDDVYYATLTGSLLDLLDLERVEVLRGPQGTLAGKNSIGGAIKLYSRKPNAENSGFFSATYGSRDRVDLRGSANIALADNLFLRISGVDRRQEGYIDRIDYGCAFPASGVARLRTDISGCVVARDSNVNFSALRAALRWLPSERLELNWSLDYTDDNRNPTGAVLLQASSVPNVNIQPNGNVLLPLSQFVVPYGSYYTYASYYSPPVDTFVGALPVNTAYDPALNGLTLGTDLDWPLLESRNTAKQFFKGGGTSLAADWSISDALALTSVTAWRWYDSGFVNDNDLSPLASSIGDGTLPFHSFSQELRLNGTAAGEAVNWTLGAFYMDQVSRYESWQDLRYIGGPNARNPLQFQQNDRVAAETAAVFGHLSWSLTDRFTVNAGLRYTDESKTYDFVRKNRDGSVHSFLGVLDGVQSEYEGDNLDYRANLQYAWTPDLMTYVQYATGFKGGGISPRPFVPTQAVPFDTETLNTWEAGVKSDLLDRRLRLNGSVYFGKYKDIQSSMQICNELNNPPGTPGPCGAWTNAGDADVKGFEVEGVLRPVARLSFDASYSYYDFEYTRLDPAVGTLIQMGFTTPFSPKSKWAVGGQYEFRLGNGSSIVPRVDVAGQSSFYTNSNNQPTNLVEGYELVNARLTWRSTDGTFDVALEGTNLTDKYYLTSRADQLTAAGHTDGAPGRPREWAVTLKKRF